MIKLLIISNGYATCHFEDSEGLFDGCHILLNGLCGLELQGVELIRCLLDVAVLCAVDVICWKFGRFTRNFFRVPKRSLHFRLLATLAQKRRKRSIR